ncbi:MFS transporter [Actinokineospora soli]|uniref:MFS transporter n=1 Tax=Actinokineospora soli TaxID=1048753 RepID=A0ABW2TQB1_9PSEU
MTTQLGAIAGPALGGVALAAFDLSGAYGGATAAIVVSTLLLTRLPALPPVPDDDEPEDAEKAGALASIGEALRFVRGNQVIAGVLLIDLFATGFGLPQTLFPQMVDERFHGGPEMVGALAAAPAVGALIASITSGWTGHVRKPGAALIAAVLALGVAYIGFGLSPNLAVALLFLAAVGAVDSISEILRRALLQHHTPDRLQGRVTSLWLAQSSTGYSLGSTTSGIAAGFVGPGLAIIGAGALCVISVAGLAAAAPGLRAATLGVSSTSDPDGVIGGTEEPLGNRQG